MRYVLEHLARNKLTAACKRLVKFCGVSRPLVDVTQMLGQENCLLCLPSVACICRFPLSPMLLCAVMNWRPCFTLGLLCQQAGC